MNNTHQKTKVKSNLEQSIKQDILNHYFPNNAINGVSECKFSIRFKDLTVLKVLFLPKTTYRTYYLMVKTNEIQYQTNINHKEKDILKILLKSSFS